MAVTSASLITLILSSNRHVEPAGPLDHDPQRGGCGIAKVALAGLAFFCAQQHALHPMHRTGCAHANLPPERSPCTCIPCPADCALLRGGGALAAGRLPLQVSRPGPAAALAPHQRVRRGGTVGFQHMLGGVGRTLCWPAGCPDQLFAVATASHVSTASVPALTLTAPSHHISTRRRFSASEGSRLLTAWAYLRRRQPFNPGAGGGQLALICC